MICAASQPDAMHVKQWNMPWIRCWKDHCGSRKTLPLWCLIIASKWAASEVLRWQMSSERNISYNMLSVNSCEMLLKLRIVRHWQVSVHFVCFKHVVNTDSDASSSYPLHPPKKVHKCPAWRETCNAPVTVPKSGHRRGPMFLILSFYLCKSAPRCWVSQWEHVAPSPLSPRNSIETWAWRSCVSTFPRSAGKRGNLELKAHPAW